MGKSGIIVLKNPLPEAVTDKGKVRQFFKLFGQGENRVIMPAYGNSMGTSHTCQKVLYDVYCGSPSAQACATWLNKMAFGGDGGSVEVVRSAKAGRKSSKDRQPLTDEENEAFDTWFEGLGLNFTQFSELSCELEKENFIPDGNHYLRIRLAETNGVWKASFKVECFMTTAPFYRKSNSDTKYLATVENWEYETGKVIGVTTASEIGKEFNWVQRGKGVWETIVHYKNRDSFAYYGRSQVLGIINQMYAEYQKGNQAAKIERVATVAKYLIETPEEIVHTQCYDENKEPRDCEGCDRCQEAPREKSLADGLRHLSTNEGENPHDIVVDFYNKEEGGASTLHKFDVMRDSKWLESSSKELRNLIHATGFNIPAELTKMEKLSGGLNSEQLLIMLITTDEESVQPTRTRWHNYWSHVIGEIARKTERPDMAGYGIEFEDKIGNVIEKIKELRKDAKTQDAPSGE